jgi:hypothetical protein
MRIEEVMSNKTRTRKTRTIVSTNSPDRTLRPVPDQTMTAKARTDTEDKLWEALHANPNSTAAALSMAAKIGRSTAQKILATWAGDGSVTRTAGIAEGGRRAADLWTIAEADVAADDAQVAAEIETAKPIQAQPAVVEAIKPVDDVAASDAATTAGGAKETGEKVERLAPGALRGMVEDHLREHPGEEFGPTEIANALAGKSSGAVSNALDKLVADGTAVKTKDKPRRFALAPAELVATPAPTN